MDLFLEIQSQTIKKEINKLIQSTKSEMRKDVFHKLMKQYHPDKNQNETDEKKKVFHEVFIYIRTRMVSRKQLIEEKV